MEKSLKPLYLIGGAASLVLLLSFIWDSAPLRDAALMQPVDNFFLQAGWGYLLLAPWMNILDLLTSLSTTQHAAMILTMLLLPILITLVRSWSEKTKLQLLIQTIKTAVISLVCIVIIYAIALFVPRPMTALIAADKDIVLVDFHSHTNYSHDANRFFGSEANRWWHEQAGFHAAFVTDHKSYQGIIEGKRNNPAQAKGGVLLLDAIEAYHQTGHILALCATENNARDDTYEWAPISEAISPCEPLLVQALPAPVADAVSVFKQRRIEAIELHDGAPLGLQEIKHRSQLLEKARQADLALVSGSDNHGWAYAANGWSALRIPGWQEMDADALALAITQLIREKRFHAVQVVERNMLLPAEHPLQHAAMPVQLLWHMFQTISLSERLSWFLWLSGLVFLTRKR